MSTRLDQRPSSWHLGLERGGAARRDNQVVKRYSGVYRANPGTSRKSLTFKVHSSALLQIAHAAMARSISRPRGARTFPYSAAAVAASCAPNAIAASPGHNASCATNSSSRRGPRCHSYSTNAGSAIRSPLAIARRSAGAKRRAPVSASISTEVSSRITSFPPLKSYGHPIGARVAGPRAPWPPSPRAPVECVPADRQIRSASEAGLARWCVQHVPRTLPPLRAQRRSWEYQGAAPSDRYAPRCLDRA